MIVNDLYCKKCDRTLSDQWFRYGEEPVCCGMQMSQDWSHGRPPATDIHEVRRFEGLEGNYSSTRQAESAAKRRAEKWTREQHDAGRNFSWTIDGCDGDKRGGARDVRRKRNSAFSFNGQTSRVSTGERA